MAAAVTILTPLAKQILGKAADLATEQLGLLLNFKSELRKLKDTVTTIQAVLRDAEEKQFHNHQIRLWLERLSDAMYDVDDLLDDLSTEARRKEIAEAEAGGKDLSTRCTSCWSVVCFLFSSLPKQLAYDLKMARAIKAIRERLDDISKEKEIFHLEVDHPIKDEALLSRETDSCPPTIVVGREDDKKNMIQLLLHSNRESNISVVPIVGMGGLGKTTLAQLVFDDHQVKSHFDIKAWVYVSQTFNVNSILQKMLQSMARETDAASSLEVLQAHLRETIEGKRFLFVLDDIWEESSRDWEVLGKYLTVGASGSKVLVTTRSTKVAEVGGGALISDTSTDIVKPYQLKGLSEEECWNLLVKKTRPHKVPQDPQVQKIGKQILRKCHGVPLVVSTIAGVLVDSKDPKTEWPSFLKKGLSSIMKGEEDPIMAALQLSFNHLPSHIKHCFTYCALFPKGFNFDIKMLVQLWVAQGYTESGINCFKILWWRSFFQEVKMDESGNMSSCRMHDLMHDLAVLTAGEKITRSSSSTFLKDIPPRTRHVLISGDCNDDPREEDNGGYGLENASKVRTLICLGSLSNTELEQVLNNFSCLRVLIVLETFSAFGSDAEDTPTLFKSIDRLKHLKYLSVDCAGRKQLLYSVTNLVNLQVLNLVNVWPPEELLRDAMTLVSLKHLVLRCYNGVKFPNWLSRLTNLIELSLYDCMLCEYLPPLHQMSSLKKLIIQNCPLLKGVNNNGDHCDSSSDHSTTRLTAEEEEDIEWPRFRCLDHLLIQKCPRLTRLPTFPTIGELHLYDASLAPFARTMKMRMRRGEEGVDYSDDASIHPSSSSSAFVRPLSKLTKLCLCGIDDDLESLSHRDSSSCLVSLEELMIQQCKNGSKLPGSLCSGIYLAVICLLDCRKVEYLPPLHELPSLGELLIAYCPELKGCWWKKKKKGNNNNDDIQNDGGDHYYYYYNFDPSREEDNEDEEEEEWPHFSRLYRLEVLECPKLTRMPLFPTVEGELRLEGTSAEALVRTMKMMKPAAAHHQADSQQHSSSSLLQTALVTPLFKLTSLHLWEINDLESLLEEGLRNLSSLEKLVISVCPRVVSLPPAMRHLTSLQSLSIARCPQLSERCRKGEGEDWPNISHIPYIRLDRETLQGSGTYDYADKRLAGHIHRHNIVRRLVKFKALSRRWRKRVR